jgi:hypothetical protein
MEDQHMDIAPQYYAPFAMNALLDPPAQYDRPYHGTLVIERVEPRDIYTRCKGAALGFSPVGCAFAISQNVCLVILPKDYGFPRQWMERLERHERAHCNGWEHD